MAFDFQTVLRLQKGCGDAPIRAIDFNEHPRLKEAKTLIDSSRVGEAIGKLDAVVNELSLPNLELGAGDGNKEKAEAVKEVTEIKDVTTIEAGDGGQGAVPKQIAEAVKEVAKVKDVMDIEAGDGGQGAVPKQKAEAVKEVAKVKDVAGIEASDGGQGAVPKCRSQRATKATATLSRDKLSSSSASASASNAATTDLSEYVMAMGLFLRGEAHFKAGNYVKARDDAQNCILHRPNLMAAYSLLSAADLSRKQYGRAEVALVLGLRFDKDHEELVSRLRSFRAQHDEGMFPQIKMSDIIGTQHLLEKHAKAMTNLGKEKDFPLHRVAICIMEGDYMGLVRAWNASLVTLRCGSLQNPLMHFPILGMQGLGHSNDGVQSVKRRVENYKKIIDFLFDQGVRLDARDKLGWSALFHAVAPTTQDTELLVYLLEKGADPNLQTVRGSVPLLHSTTAQDTKTVEIFLSHGANPFICDNDGDTAYKSSTQFKEMYALFDKYVMPKMPKKVCSVCKEKGSKRCTKCRVVVYCGEVCQKVHWSSHKKRCKQLVKGHKRLTISEDKLFKDTANFINFGNPAQALRRGEPIQIDAQPSARLFNLYMQEYKEKGNLLLKISGDNRWVSRAFDFLPREEGDADPPFMVYNQDKSFYCYLDLEALDGKDFKKILIERSGLVCKGYFWAFMEPGKKEVVIITEPRLPAQPW